MRSSQIEQREFIAFLSQLEQELHPATTRAYLMLDNLNMHKGKQVQAWLEAHPRFVCSFTPVHCLWMNQVEQRFSILQRKRLRISDFSNLDHLAERLMAFVTESNMQAHPFNWSSKSVARMMAKCDTQSVHIPTTGFPFLFNVGLYLELLTYKVAPIPLIKPKRPGGPRKASLPHSNLPKQPRGYPRKQALLDTNMSKRPRGRPRKNR